MKAPADFGGENESSLRKTVAGRGLSHYILGTREEGTGIPILPRAIGAITAWLFGRAERAKLCCCKLIREPGSARLWVTRG
jgi:hypothetical protein